MTPAADAVPQDNQTRSNAVMHATVSSLREAIATTAGLLDTVVRNVTASAEKAEKAEKAAEKAASKTSGDIPEMYLIQENFGVLSPNDFEGYLDRVVKVTDNAFFDGVSTYDGVFTMAKLEEVKQTLRFGSSTNVKTITFGSLVQVGEDIIFERMHQLESIVFKALTTIGRDFSVSGCPKLTSLALPKLRTVGKNFRVEYNNALRSLAAAAITKIKDALNLRDNGPSGHLAIGSTCARLKAAARHIDSGQCTA